mmetsp:Transcript_23521/g.80154  ORF Transcript_23521/g.80154 Transcript_23521/m.80154 type:complete len:383 (-) Transcript_23521:77-1225(-)
MAPALEGSGFFDASASGRGLRLLPPGSAEPVEPMLGPDAVLVLLGEGARDWFPGAAAPPLVVPAHDVAASPEPRAWFGRMVLPPPHARASPLGPTFSEWHSGAGAALAAGAQREEGAVGCSPLGGGSGAARRSLSDEGSCGAGQVYCWMSCVDVPEGAGCGADEAQCVGPDGSVWPDEFEPGAHCQECYVACPAEEDAPPGGFCNTRIPPTTMFMDGFHIGGRAEDPCVVFLFKGAALSSPGLLALGFFATALLAVAVEGLVALRRLPLPGGEGKAAWRVGGAAASGWVKLALYALQGLLGYCLMLLAMTYQAELLAAVVLGLAAGHHAFNRGAPVAESNDACCRHDEAALVPRAPPPEAAAAAERAAQREQPQLACCVAEA